MPKRLLSDGVLTSDRLEKLTGEAELFFYRLLVVVDDYGRMDARPGVLRAKCFPLRVDSIDADMVAGWLRQLADVGLVRLYEAEGREYLVFNKWTKHQRIRAKESKWPDPPPQNAAGCSNSQQKAPVVVDEDEDESRKKHAVRRKAPTFSLAAYSPEFETWWVSYPAKRGSKAETAKLYAAWVESGVPPDKLLAAAKNYTAECRRNGTEAKFVMHGETFLARERQPWATYAEKPAHPGDDIPLIRRKDSA